MVTLAAGFEAKDWVSNGIAVLALIATSALGLWTNRRNRAAQSRQEELVRTQHDTNTRLAEILERLADRVDAGTAAAARNVEWALEHASKHRWLLRNLGPATARGVVIDRDALGGARVDLQPEPPADLGPGESLSITALEAWGAPLADEIRVRWDDTEMATLPLPRWL
ncbi:hypothetical protein DMP17_44785 [Pseudonocardia sp. TMWB2A]|uniref:hypothetical protein n=1 Tax=Pseudonocardia sp. TMWB2A TaxID=687430 RepID=UPI00307E2EE2